jgi:hypothetical protein
MDHHYQPIEEASPMAQKPGTATQNIEKYEQTAPLIIEQVEAMVIEQVKDKCEQSRKQPKHTLMQRDTLFQKPLLMIVA